MKTLSPLFILCLFTVGCAGPATPFGAVAVVVPVKPAVKPMEIVTVEDRTEEKRIEEKRTEEKAVVTEVRVPASIIQRTKNFLLGSGAKPTIHFSPDRQVLHDRTTFQIRIEDNLGIQASPDVTILYNGQDLTDKFMAQAKDEIVDSGRTYKLTFPNLRLLAGRENKVEVVYRHSKNDNYVFARYQPPTCGALNYDPVITTGSFKLKDSMLKTIDKMSKEHKINPAFFAGLIAQESAFDHQAISWAKAIGLTQVTSVAEEEILKYYSAWPRYEGVRGMPMPILKTMILSGEINAKNEWRLNPVMSMRGGLTYLSLLSQYWRRPDNFSKIAAQFKDPEEGFTQVLLASYNSGFVRVGSAMDRSGPNWVKEEDLKEARKYIGRILSYCYHFSHSGDDNGS